MSISQTAPVRRGVRCGALLLALALLVPAASFLPVGASASTPVYAEDFESGAAGWNATGLWGLNGDRAGNGNTSFYYGVSTAPGTGDNTFDTGAPNSGTLTSPAIDLTGLTVATLRFWTYWDGEGCPYEHPVVEVSTNGTQGPFDLVHEECTSTGSGTVAVNLTAYAGQVIHVRFAWETGDAINNGGEGWYVDDVRVTPDAAPPAIPPRDLAAGFISVPSLIVDGDTVGVRALIHHNGATNVTFDVEFFVDNATLSILPGVTAPAYSSIEVEFSWTATAGNHIVGIRIDPSNAVIEVNETNNVRAILVHVHAGLADLSVDIVDVEKVYLQTDNGEIRPNPLQRHLITVEVCNEGEATASYAYVDVYATGSAFVSSSDFVGSASYVGLAPGACVTETFTWDGFAAAGDVTLRAWAYTYPERELDNNEDTAQTFVLVGGTGLGVVGPL